MYGRAAEDATAVDPPSVRYSILGPVTVERSDELLRLGGRQARVLLAMLLLRANRAVSVDELSSGLWNSDPPPSAATALRVHIAQLRRLLEPQRPARSPSSVLQAANNGYVLLVDEDRLDANRFERCLDLASSHRQAGRWDQVIEAIQAGLDLWRGPALDDVRDVLALSADAVRLDQSRLTARETVIDAHLRLGHHREVIGDLERLIVEFPYHEAFTGQLMLALYRSGRQAEAIRAFTRTRRLLADELGIEPSTPLADLERAILQQQAHLEWQDDAPDPAVAHQHVRFAGTPRVPRRLARTIERGALLGRDSELQACQRVWERASRGEGQLLVITGDAGSGKTRLVAELCLRVVKEGSEILYGGCDEDALFPFQPFREALQDRLDADPGSAGQQLVGPALAELFPQGGLPGEGPTDVVDDTSRLRLFESVASALADAIHHRPLIVVVDDLQWADKPSLLLLRYLVRRLADCPILFVATARSAASPAADAVDDVLLDFHREAQVDRVRLKGLDRPSVRHLVEALLPPQPDVVLEGLAASLHELSEGNPFFVRELVGHLIDTGSIQPDLQFPLDLVKLGIPDQIRGLLARRRARLSTSCTGILQLASVIGTDFDLDLLTEVAGSSDEAVLEALEEAIAGQIIEESSVTFERYRFSHALFRETFYADMTTARRARTHRSVGEALERLTAMDGGDNRLAELAHHFCAAAKTGCADKALHYSHRAGQHAMAQFAFEDAAALFDRALAVVESLESHDDELECELLLALGGARSASGNTSGGREAFDRAAIRAHEAGLAAHFARAALGWGSEWATVTVVGGGTFAALLSEALGMLGASHRNLRAKVQSRLAWIEFHKGDLRSAQDHARAALDDARRGGDKVALADALSARHQLMLGPEDAEERLWAAEEVIRLAKEAGDLDRVLTGCIHRIADLLQLGRVTEARSALQVYRSRVERVRRPIDLWWSCGLDAAFTLFTGPLQEAERQMERALGVAQDLQQEDGLRMYSIQLYVLRWLQGLLPALGPAVDGFVAEQPHVLGWRAARALVLAESGDVRGARQELAVLSQDDFGRLQRDSVWLGVLVIAAEASFRCGDRRAAAALHRILQPYAGRNVVLGPGTAALGALDRSLALLAHLDGRTGDAARHFEAAANANSAMGAVPWLVLTHRQHAEFLKTCSNAHRADELVAAADELDAAVASPALPSS